MREYEEAAIYILEVIMRRQRYSSDVRDKIAAHIEKTHRAVDRAQVLKEAKLLLKNSS